MVVPMLSIFIGRKKREREEYIYRKRERERQTHHEIRTKVWRFGARKYREASS
jgi:hypothetical protein